MREILYLIPLLLSLLLDSVRVVAKDHSPKAPSPVLAIVLDEGFLDPRFSDRGFELLSVLRNVCCPCHGKNCRIAGLRTSLRCAFALMAVKLSYYLSCSYLGIVESLRSEHIGK